MKDCSLLISTYNWPEALDLCLKSVMRQAVFPKEILIADDGSGAQTRQLIERYQEMGRVNIKHIWHQDQGFRLAEIRNKAIAQAQTNYIIQIDGDIILDKHFVQDHLVVAEKNCFVRGTRGHIEESSVRELLETQRIHLTAFSKGIKHRFNTLRIPALSWLLTKKERKGGNVKGCNLAYWKDDFIRVNGYNNELQGWGHEDEEFTTRMANAGILRKKVKLRCVQFHIFHPLASRAQENQHEQAITALSRSGRSTCSNGFAEVLNTG